MFPFENVSELAGAYERRNIRSPLKPISITPAHRSAHSIFVPLRSHALLSLRANPGTIPFCDEQWRNTNLDRIHTSETLIAKYQLAIADGPARRTASWPSRRTQRRTLCVINSLVVRTKLTTHYTKLKEASVPMQLRARPVKRRECDRQTRISEDFTLRYVTLSLHIQC